MTVKFNWRLSPSPIQLSKIFLMTRLLYKSWFSIIIPSWSISPIPASRGSRLWSSSPPTSGLSQITLWATWIVLKSSIAPWSAIFLLWIWELKSWSWKTTTSPKLTSISSLNWKSWSLRKKRLKCWIWISPPSSL